MKKSIKGMTILLLVCALFLFTSCGSKETSSTMAAAPEKKITKIEMEDYPKTNYLQYETISVEGGKIKIIYDDESNESTPLTTNMISGFDTETIGEKQITVKYEEFNTSYSINVDLRSFSATAINYSGYYDGEKHQFTIEGLIEGDVVSYKYAGSEYVSVNPEFTKTGIYDVYYKIERQNYKDFEGKATVEIKKDDIQGIWFKDNDVDALAIGKLGNNTRVISNNEIEVDDEDSLMGYVLGSPVGDYPMNFNNNGDGKYSAVYTIAGQAYAGNFTYEDNTLSSQNTIYERGSKDTLALNGYYCSNNVTASINGDNIKLSLAGKTYKAAVYKHNDLKYMLLASQNGELSIVKLESIDDGFKLIAMNLNLNLTMFDSDTNEMSFVKKTVGLESGIYKSNSSMYLYVDVEKNIIATDITLSKACYAITAINENVYNVSNGNTITVNENKLTYDGVEYTRCCGINKLESSRYYFSKKGSSTSALINVTPNEAIVYNYGSSGNQTSVAKYDYAYDNAGTLYIIGSGVRNLNSDYEEIDISKATEITRGTEIKLEYDNDSYYKVFSFTPIDTSNYYFRANRISSQSSEFMIMGFDNALYGSGVDYLSLTLKYDSLSLGKKIYFVAVKPKEADTYSAYLSLFDGAFEEKEEVLFTNIGTGEYIRKRADGDYDLNITRLTGQNITFGKFLDCNIYSLQAISIVINPNGDRAYVYYTSGSQSYMDEYVIFDSAHGHDLDNRRYGEEGVSIFFVDGKGFVNVFDENEIDAIYSNGKYYGAIINDKLYILEYLKASDKFVLVRGEGFEEVTREEFVPMTGIYYDDDEQMYIWFTGNKVNCIDCSRDFNMHSCDYAISNDGEVLFTCNEKIYKMIFGG